MKAWQSMLWIILSLALASCATSPHPPAPVEPVSAEGSRTASEPPENNQPNEPGDGKLLERLNEYYQNGIRKIDQGMVSEGISQLVAVLAEVQGAGERDPGVESVAHDTRTELQKINAALSLDAGPEWTDEDKNQISASALDVATDKALNPSVILTLNFGAGKALVGGAPIFFELVKGSGLLTSFVNTNEYGQATCSVASLENQNEENIIRASLVYRVRGFAYRFSGIERDFVYVPPTRRATILVLEKSDDPVTQDPVILDAVFNRLKGVAFDFSQYDGRLLGQQFMTVFGGDPQAIRRLGLEKEVSYLVMVLNDGYYVNQVELSGKKYNIYKSKTTATTRIIRVVDGKIMYSATVQAVPGQGGTRQKAVLDGFRKAAEAMSAKLEQDLSQIADTLAGTETRQR